MPAGESGLQGFFAAISYHIRRKAAIKKLCLKIGWMGGGIKFFGAGARIRKCSRRTALRHIFENFILDKQNLQIFRRENEKMELKKLDLKSCRSWLAVLLAAAMLVTMPGTSALAETADREMPYNPVHYCTEENGSTDITDWSYVYFGSYPQTEIAGSALTAKITGASYDGNGDAWVDGVKYRRISKRDANNDYYFGDSTYRYFKWEKIKWRVLDNNGSTLFVMADKGLDCKDYNEEVTYMSWENCTIRNWLNNDFYRTAFDGGEQGAIVEQTVVNEESPWSWGNTEKGNDTRDKVFLLSCGEAVSSRYGFCENYDTDSVARGVKASDYAYAMGASKLDIDIYRGNSWLALFGLDQEFRMLNK